MTADDAKLPNYDPEQVEGVVLETVIGVHPEHFTTEALCQRVVSDSDNSREMAVAREAIHSLKRVGVFYEREDEIVKPIPAVVRMGELLVGPIGITLDSE